jgi:hypothetical protein
MWCEDKLLAAAYVTFSKNKTKRRKHKIWVRQSLQEGNEYGVSRLMNSLSKDDLLSGHIIDGPIQNFIRISSSDLEWLLSCVKPLIRIGDTNYRAAISPLERCFLCSLLYIIRLKTKRICFI